MRYIYILAIFISLSCSSGSSVEQERTGYIERKLSFFDPNESLWIDGQNQGYILEHWIREPENLKMVYETFKEVGIKKLFDQEDRFSTITCCGIQIRKPMNELIDSLILTYKQDTIYSKYYREFWNRRDSENNKKITYEILVDLTSELYEDHLIEPEQEFVNDTLFNLVQIRELPDSITPELANQHFEYLTKIGMHQSAYNLLFESYRYSHLNWDRDELLKQLTEDTVNCCPEPWIVDDTK